MFVHCQDVFGWTIYIPDDLEDFPRPSGCLSYILQPNTSWLRAVYVLPLIINPSPGIYQEIYPWRAIRIGNALINPSLKTDFDIVNTNCLTLPRVKMYWVCHPLRSQDFTPFSNFFSGLDKSRVVHVHVNCKTCYILSSFVVCGTMIHHQDLVGAKRGRLPLAEKPVRWLSASRICRGTPAETPQKIWKSAICFADLQGHTSFQKKRRKTHENLLAGYLLMAMFWAWACMFKIVSSSGALGGALGDLFGRYVK